METFWPKPPVKAHPDAYWLEQTWRHLNIITVYFWLHRVRITGANLNLLLDDPLHPNEIARLFRERRSELVARESEWCMRGRYMEVLLADVIDYCDAWESRDERCRAAVIKSCRAAVGRTCDAAGDLIPPGQPWWS